MFLFVPWVGRQTLARVQMNLYPHFALVVASTPPVDAGEGLANGSSVFFLDLGVGAGERRRDRGDVGMRAVGQGQYRPGPGI